MCGGGGGRGPSSETKALQQAQLRQMQEDEQRRENEEARRLAAVNSINKLYGIGNDAAGQLAGRNAAYDQVRQNNLGLMMADIARNRADAGRDVRFGLQRSGLFGGSVDIAANRDITDANQRSVIQANQLADNQVARMRSEDEGTRADLISRINAGLDADSAATTAAQRMAINRQAALSEPSSGALNNLFAGIGNMFSQYQFANGAANPYGNMNKSVSQLGGYGGKITY